MSKKLSIGYWERLPGAVSQARRSQKRIRALVDEALDYIEEIGPEEGFISIPLGNNTGLIVKRGHVWIKNHAMRNFERNQFHTGFILSLARQMGKIITEVERHGEKDNDPRA